MCEDSNEIFVTERKEKTMTDRQTDRNFYLSMIKIKVQ